MSVVRGYGLNGKSIYANVTKPQLTWLTFTVDAANTNGLGVTSVKSNGYIESVFMHTSQTPGAVNGFTNPNPLSGYALVRFKNPFNYYLGTTWSQAVPTTSNTTTSLTAGHVYVITLVGTTTTANWQAVGLLPGLTPTVGQAFVATATTSITGTGTVGVAGVPVVNTVTVVGSPSASITNSNIGVNAGAQLLLQFAATSVSGTVSAPTLTMNSYTPAGTITNGTPDTFAGTPAVLTGTNSAPTFTNTSVFAATAPADNTVFTFNFAFDGSSVTIDGI